MKKHILPIIVFILVLLFIFLCVSDTAVNSEDLKTGKGFIFRSPSILGEKRSVFKIKESDPRLLSQKKVFHNLLSD